MYLAVVKACPNEDFTLLVEFEDGSEGLLDMKPYLDFGVFRRLKSLDEFKKAHIAFDTVEWDCGIDLDPEFVFAKSQIKKTA